MFSSIQAIQSAIASGKTVLDIVEHYLQKIEEVKQNKAELLGNKYLLEKYAREKYLMKKPSEDIYLIEEEQYKD
jgi:cell division protein FtsB